ncbi:hypothetical protein Lesp02_61220 [Lentzea sp. NBRC 105346]|uniref:hypothetical protein n=1 Tax=Lentzea sp. NBRC 105346 TaxID=3032205 RepID=UPI002553EF41|nr:hypothetical protein [Lentzea sp. NBRC 105346]GLZ33934.1 hypothetical protein Lesp02_61220 [Lentzea sp. NBRC 105346]
MSRIASIASAAILIAATLVTTAPAAQAAVADETVVQYDENDSPVAFNNFNLNNDQDGILFDAPGATHFTFTNLGTGEVEYAQGVSTGSGSERLCTVTSSFADEPLLVPINVQRGGQDDCVRFRIK